MRFKPWFQLVRLPNVFTAAADPLAGWLLGGGTFHMPQRWLPLLGASMMIYAGGIALNDVMDYAVDRVERPQRPLPSGRVWRRGASILAVACLTAGVALAAASGSVRSFGIATVLSACVLLYDLVAKRSPLGPEVMGACRGLNVLLGLSQAPALGGPGGFLVAGAMMLFVTGVTWISRFETETGRNGGAIAGWGLQAAGLLGLLVAGFAAQRFPAGDEASAQHRLIGIAVLLTVGVVVNRATIRAVREPNPRHLQAAVKTGVLSVVWLNVGIVAAVRGPLPALAVAGLWVPAYLLGRWLYST
jgi:4-hydroxybenzoate polyprenyltransferase